MTAADADVERGVDAAEEPLDAGPIGEWVMAMRAALLGARDADVPCGACTACCTSSQFVPVGPDETDALARIPPALRFPAPGLPPGHVVLPYDERGHCPMLVDGACSIYEQRPRTCRTYDCRVFPATGVTLDDPAKAAITRRAARWRFGVTSDADRAAAEGLRAAAARVADHPDRLPADRVPRNATERAVLAVEMHVGLVPDTMPGLLAPHRPLPPIPEDD